MESYHKRKRLLEEKYGKITKLKQFNDERAPASRRRIVDNSQQKSVKQLQDITDDEGFRLAYEKKMAFTNITIHYL